MQNQPARGNFNNFLDQQNHQQARGNEHSFNSVIPLPENKDALQKEIRFNMDYCKANKLNQTAKWLGELLVTLKSSSPQDKEKQLNQKP